MNKEQVIKRIKEIISKDSRLKSETIEVVFKTKNHYKRNNNGKV